MKFYWSAFALAASLTGCAAHSQVTYAAPSTENISTTMEEGRGRTRSQIIYVVNGSSEPIVVQGVTLRSCENVKQRCEEPQVTNISVGPGARSVVLRVEPRNNATAYSYRFSYSWRRAQAAASQ